MTDGETDNIAAVAPPSASTVLYMIYNVDGDGADSYEIANGSVASFWYGHRFDFHGKHYFVGFTTNTAQKFGKEGEDTPGPEATVAIAQATFEMAAPGAGKPWKLVDASRWCGDFGGYEIADAVDRARKAQSFETAGGQFVLAVPTKSLQSGVDISGFAIFRFTRAELKDPDDRHWLYLGTVVTGEDNAAACDGGTVMTCASSSGSLAFKEDPRGGHPVLQVSRTGTTVDSPGKTRALGAADASLYVFDKDKNTYVQQ